MSVWPAWEVQEAGGATSWFHVRLGFVDGARVELLAVVCGGRVSVEDVRAQPPLSLVDLTVLADWIEGPLFERCDEGGALEAADGQGGGDAADMLNPPSMAEMADMADVDGGFDAEDAREPAVAGDAGEAFAPRRARPAWPRGVEGRWLVAQEYRAAQEEGADPVLAVMCATGHSRRRSLRLIAQARDAGYLSPRHARR
ncbi:MULTISPECIES: DUF6214 family protein [unclassified Streptomyces]|uniref:DUF6214 family protein n=1 Tax=unclassified Streptomyces TaxID=2593676 RepID=UPI00070F35A0|nr:DUF6214 family protein [Streptomyces sp. Root1310]KQX64178.1 hypothetical protein ASD48_22910 [Streptomyces sp. Root1310]